jgi:K+-sensing histidine kinase KdpD
MKERSINSGDLRYSLLAEASIDAAKGVARDQIIKNALDKAIEAIGLVSGSVRVVDDKGKLLFIHIAGRNEFSEMMRQVEEKLLATLRDDFAVGNVFLTFEQDGNYSLFSYPLKVESKVYGTISGITPGERSLSAEEDFIRAISAVLGLILSRGTTAEKPSPQDIVKARSEAVVETAVTINHEVNNPLTAVLGNIQLLLLNADDYPPEMRAKLRAVEESALKIKEVTQNLMRVIEPSVVEYTTGLKMVDLARSKLKEIKETEEKKASEEEKKKED